MGKFSRTWRMMRASWDVLRQDKEMLVFPVLSAVAVILVLFSFALPLMSEGTWQYLDESGRNNGLIVYGWLFVFYLASYFVMIFFNAAIVACALERMNGGDPTVMSGLRAAWSRLPQIFGWALMTGTVGFLLRMLEERVGLIGQIVVAILGLTWTVTAYLVVPLLVHEGLGPVDAYKRSVTLLKQSWGEQIIGNVSFALIFMAFGAVPVALIALAGMTGNEYVVGTVAAVAGVAILVLLLVQSTLQAIYQAAVYSYACNGTAPTGFDEQAMAGVFRKRM